MTSKNDPALLFMTITVIFLLLSAFFTVVLPAIIEKEDIKYLDHPSYKEP